MTQHLNIILRKGGGAENDFPLIIAFYYSYLGQTRFAQDIVWCLDHCFFDDTAYLVLKVNVRHTILFNRWSPRSILLSYFHFYFLSFFPYPPSPPLGDTLTAMSTKLSICPLLNSLYKMQWSKQPYLMQLYSITINSLSLL